MRDEVDDLMEAWARERAGLDARAMAGELEPVAVTSRKGAHE